MLRFHYYVWQKQCRKQKQLATGKEKKSLKEDIWRILRNGFAHIIFTTCTEHSVTHYQYMLFAKLSEALSFNSELSNFRTIMGKQMLRLQNVVMVHCPPVPSKHHVSKCPLSLEILSTSTARVSWLLMKGICLLCLAFNSNNNRFYI